MYYIQFVMYLMRSLSWDFRMCKNTIKALKLNINYPHQKHS